MTLGNARTFFLEKLFDAYLAGSQGHRSPELTRNKLGVHQSSDKKVSAASVHLNVNLRAAPIDLGNENFRTVYIIS
jgi:hypothetical protein